MPRKKVEDDFTPNPAHLDGVDDLCQMEHLEEGNVLHNLKYRYDRSQINTATTSKVLIVVNPYEKFPGVDSKETMQKYHDLPSDMEGLMDSKDTPPNVFGVAHVGYSNLVNNKQNQSMIVCGESGAGKTESAKLIMRFLAFSSTSNETDPQKYEEAEAVGAMVLDANPILESFGNAKTVLNNNSSRFGKFTKMLFDEHKTDAGLTRTLIGSSIDTYLLEKSRIVHQEGGERNFHAFYYLTTDLGKQRFPHCQISGTSADYHYTNQSNTYFKTSADIPDEDTDDLTELLHAFNTLNFDEETQNQIMAVVGGLLHLGNVEFDEQKNGVSIRNPDVLATCAQVLQLDEQKLSRRLTHQTLVVVDKSYEKELNLRDALFNRDSIVKGVYSGLFDYIVKHINAQSAQGDKNTLWIGTLDVFGFEIFENNSFEQFCINLANERLQQFFNYHVLHTEQTLYLKESLIWDPVDLPDNSDVIDLVVGRQGIIQILDSSCVSKGTSKSFIDNLFKVRPHRRMRKVTKRPGGKSSGGQFVAMTGFSVQHYAGTVTYDADTFLLKNADQNPPDTIALFKSSGSAVASALFPEEKKSSKKSKVGTASRSRKTEATRAFKSVGNTFSTQLQSLMTTLDKTQPFFIRCIKPNTVKKPKQFDPEYVRPQLRCGGLVQALHIIKLGFPVRCTYAKIWSVFGSILENYSTPTNINFRDFTEAIMMKLGDRQLDPDEYQLGLTMVFFRPGKQAFLQTILRRDPADISTSEIEEIREFMVSKRILRCRGALRSAVRLRHVITRRRILTVAQSLQIVHRTLGKSLLTARKALAANSEAALAAERKRQQDLVDAKAGAELAKRLAKEKEETQAKWAKKTKAFEDQIAELKAAAKKSKQQASTFMKSSQETKALLLEEKQKALTSAAGERDLRAQIERIQREAANLEEQARKNNQALKESNARLLSLENEKEILSTRSKGEVQSIERALHESEERAGNLREELQSSILKNNQLTGQVEDLSERSKLSNEQYEAKLQRAQELLENEQERARTRAGQQDNDLQEKEAALNALTQEYRLFKDEAESKQLALNANVNEVKLELRDANAQAKRALEAKDSQLSSIRAEVESLTARLETSETERTQEAKAAVEAAQAAAEESASKIAALEERIRTLERELARAQQELAVAQNRITMLQEQLAESQSDSADNKRRGDSVTKDLKEKLTEAEESLRAATTAATTERLQTQERITELKQELVAAQTATRDSSTQLERKVWEAEQTASQQKHELTALEEKLATTLTRHKNQTEALQKSLDDERKHGQSRVERLQTELTENAANFAELRSEFKSDKAAFGKKELDASAQTADLIAKVNALTSELQASQRAAATAVEARNRLQNSLTNQINELTQTKSREIEQVRDQLDERTRATKSLEDRMETMRKTHVEHAEEVASLEEKYEKKLRDAEGDVDAVNARMVAMEANLQRDVEVAKQGLQGQLAIFADRVESMKQEKAATAQVIQLLQQQFRENNSATGALKAELKAKDRIIEDLEDERVREINELRLQAEMKQTNLLDDVKALQRREDQFRSQVQALQLQFQTLTDEKTEVDNSLRSQTLKLAQFEESVANLKTEQKQSLESKVAQEGKIRELSGSLNEIRANGENDLYEVKGQLQASESKNRTALDQISRLERQLNELQSGDSQASRRIREDLERSTAAKIRAAEETARLQSGQTATENKALKMELQYIKLQATVNTNIQNDNLELRRVYDEKLNQLRQQLADTQHALQASDNTHNTFKVSVKSRLQEIEDNHKYQVARLTQENHTKLLRERERANAAANAASETASRSETASPRVSSSRRGSAAQRAPVSEEPRRSSSALALDRSTESATDTFGSSRTFNHSRASTSVLSDFGLGDLPARSPGRRASMMTSSNSLPGSAGKSSRSRDHRRTRSTFSVNQAAGQKLNLASLSSLGSLGGDDY